MEHCRTATFTMGCKSSDLESDDIGPHGLASGITLVGLAIESRMSGTIQALRARTAGRSAGVGRRRALAGNVTTATVLPVMSKNSTE